MPYSNSRTLALLALGISLLAVPGLQAQTPAADAGTMIRGDVNGDGRVTREDAEAVRAYLLRGTVPAGRSILPAGDANGDGRVTAADAALISRYAAGVDVSRFPVGRPVAGGGGGDTRGSGVVATTEYECTVDVQAGTENCVVSTPGGEGEARLAVVSLGSGPLTFNSSWVLTATSATNTLSFTNNMPQPIGTLNGTDADPSGNRMYYTVMPYVSAVYSGSPGTVTLSPATDGSALFTNPNGSTITTAFYQFNGMVAPGATSGARVIQYNYPSNTKTFKYSYRIAAPVQYGDGLIVIGSVPVLVPGQEVTLTKTVYDQYGNVLSDAVQWNSSNGAVATVDGTGKVTAVGQGTTTISAESMVDPDRDGTRLVSVDAVPTVTGTTPAGGAADVLPSSDIVITFSEAVTASGSSFTLQCPGGSPQSFAVSGSGTNTITLNPSSNLPPATVCNVNVVAAQVVDMDHTLNPMAADYPFSFTVAIQANDDTFSETVLGNVSVNSANAASPFSVTANDVIDGTTTISAVGWDSDGPGGAALVPAVTKEGGNVSILPSGTFTYDPPAGFEGTDQFTYELTRNSYTTSANVTVTVADMVWFVDADAGACASNCGRMSSPFNSLAAFNTANTGAGNNPAAGEPVFLYELTSPATYTGPVTLLNDQRLIGQDATATLATLAGLTPPASAAALPPTNSGNADKVTIIGTDGINLGQNNHLYGLTLATTGGEAISHDGGVGGFGTLTLADGTSQAADVTIASSGQAIALNTGTLSGAFASVGSTGGANNISLTDVNSASAISLGAGTLSGAGSHAINVSGGSVSLTIAGTVSKGAGGALLNVGTGTGPHTGTLTFTAASTLTASDGTGLQFSNADGTYAFNGTTTFNNVGSGNAGVDILAGSGGTFTFSNNTNITNPTGTAFAVNGSTPTVTYSGNITKNGTSAGLLVDVTNQTGGGSLAANGTITFQTGTLTGTSTAGTGILLSNADGTVNFNGTTTLSSGDNGVDVIGGSTGSISFTAGAGITNSSGPGLFVDASAPSSLTFAGAISTNSSRPVHIEDLTGGTITISGAVTATGNGILVQNNTSGAPSISFTGTRNLTTGANAAVTLDNNDAATINFGTAAMTITTTIGEGFRAVNGGSVNVTGTANDVTSTTGVAVRISDTNVGASGVRFRAVSANGASNGIFLNNTGSTGGTFRVDGTGTVGSGGTIQNTVGANGATGGNGVYLSNVRNVVLTGMIINNHPNHGILGTTVNGFTLDNSRLAGTHGDDINFDEAVISITGLSGQAVFSNDSISGGIEDNVRILNHGIVSPATDSILFNNVRMGHVSTVSGNTALLVRVADGSNNRVRIRNSTFHGARGGSMFHLNVVNTATARLALDQNTFNNTQTQISGAGGVLITASGTAASIPTLTYNITNNTFRGSRTVALNINKDVGQAVINGNISDNTIGVAAVANSGSSEASGIQLRHQGGGTHRATVTNNQIFQYNNYGIILEAGDAVGGSGHGRMDMTITGNAVSNPGTLAFTWNGLHANIGTVTDDAHILCLAATGNSMDNSGTASQDIRLRQRMKTTIILPGYAGANNDNTAVNNFVKANNGNGANLVVVASNSVGVAAPNGPGNGFTNGTCNAPTL